MPYILRTLWFALLLLAAARLLNRRTLVSEKPYDFAVNVTYGTLAGTGILDLRTPLWGVSLAIAALTAFAWVMNEAGARSPRLATWLGGRPTVLVRAGRPIRANLRRVRMSERDLLAKLREFKLASVADVELAVMERDGRVGVVPKGNAPAGGRGSALGSPASGAGDAQDAAGRRGGAGTGEDAGTAEGGGTAEGEGAGERAGMAEGAEPAGRAGTAQAAGGRLPATPAPAVPPPTDPSAGEVGSPGTVPITHVEHHFTASETVRDVVIGMSDGLTVPFALAAGLSGAVAATHVIIVAGLAEIAAGSIAMGLGGYLAARTDAEHYLTERAREQEELDDHADEEEAEVVGIFRDHGVGADAAGRVARELRRRPASWLDFLMRFELGLEKPDPRRAVSSAATIAGSYVVGGMVPLSPYFVLPRVSAALPVSVAVTLVALLVFGFVKGRFSGTRPLRSALQTVLVGGLAAGAAFSLARIIGR